MSRRLVIGSVGVGLVATAAALLVVAGGTAGTGSYDFKVFGVPTQLTTGQQGLLFARFEPTKGSGASTKTVITFILPKASLAAGTVPAADPATSSDCAAAALSTDGATFTISCSIGTLNPGQRVKRFVTFVAGAPSTNTGLGAFVGFDHGASSANGGGRSDLPALYPALSIVDGTTAGGTCGSTGGHIGTSPVTAHVPQQTALSFGSANAAFQLPCSWGTVGVIDQRRGPDGAPQISSVGGPQFAAPSTLTLTFASLPVPVSEFVLKENENFNPADPTVGWNPVPPCPTATTLPKDPNVDACLVGYTQTDVIVATLLYRGTNTDPWFN